MPSHRATASPLPRVRKRPNRAKPATVRGQMSTLSAPQVGIASALGLATIAVPLSGVMSPALKAAPSSSVTLAALAPAPAFPRLPAAPAAVEHLTVIPAASALAKGADVPRALRAPEQVVVARATRSYQRSVLPGCTGVAPAVRASNGLLPTSTLCTLWNGDDRLRADAAVALAKLNIAYRQRYGSSLCLTDSYRSLSEQRRLKVLKPYLAATPGTSEHGWGLAVDMCGGVETGRSSRYYWLREVAPRYGWDNPTWARSGGSGPHEPWHWEYVAGA